MKLDQLDQILWNSATQNHKTQSLPTGLKGYNKNVVNIRKEIASAKRKKIRKIKLWHFASRFIISMSRINLNSFLIFNKNILKIVLTETPLRRRLFRNEEPHLVYQEGEFVALVVSDIKELAALRMVFGDGGEVKIGAEEAISCDDTDWWRRRFGRCGVIDTDALGGDESNNEYRRNIFLFFFTFPLLIV